MAFSRSHHPLIADAGDHRDPYRSASFHRDGGGAAAGDYSSHPESSRKHRGRPSTDGDAALAPPQKRRKAAPQAWESGSGKRYQHGFSSDAPSTSSASLPASRSEEAKSEGDSSFISRDEIERCSPSRKDGIDSILERQLRYTYCAYLQTLGLRLQIPHATVGTAMVLCHRFFLRRSHATHDRFLVATAALFLASKSEETPCLLNTLLRASFEICQENNFAFYPHLLYSQEWFDLYREHVTDAEQLILTTLDFELEVQHPYVPLASVLNKLGLSRTVLLNLAWNLVNEGLWTSLWLQFKPQHIAAGAAFLAAKFINFDLASSPNIWQEFQATPSIVQDVVQQLMEGF